MVTWRRKKVKVLTKKAIIDAIESVAHLLKKEYCIILTHEKGKVAISHDIGISKIYAGAGVPVSLLIDKGTGIIVSRIQSKGYACNVTGVLKGQEFREVVPLERANINLMMHMAAATDGITRHSANRIAAIILDVSRGDATRRITDRIKSQDFFKSVKILEKD